VEEAELWDVMLSNACLGSFCPRKGTSKGQEKTGTEIYLDDLMVVLVESSEGVMK
jgi:hypothetical protein